MTKIKTNDRFDGLTNLDISTHHREGEYWFMKSDFLGAFAYWVVAQSPYNAPHITTALRAFDKYISRKIKDDAVEKFTYEELSEFINEKIFASIPQIEKLNHAKIEMKGFIASSSRYHKTKSDYDYIDLGALAHNIFYMLLREKITQR